MALLQSGVEGFGVESESTSGVEVETGGEETEGVAGDEREDASSRGEEGELPPSSTPPMAARPLASPTTATVFTVSSSGVNFNLRSAVTSLHFSLVRSTSN